MIIFRLRRGRWSPSLGKEFRRTRREKRAVLMFRYPRVHETTFVNHDPGQLRLHSGRRAQKRHRQRPSRSRPVHRGVVIKRDGLMRCATAKRGQHELLDLDAPGYLNHRHGRANPHGKPLASAAAHHQLRHGASVFPF